MACEFLVAATKDPPGCSEDQRSRAAQPNQKQKAETAARSLCDVKAPSSVLCVPRPSDPHRDAGGCTVIPPLSGDEAGARDLRTQPVVLEPGAATPVQGDGQACT